MYKCTIKKVANCCKYVKLLLQCGAICSTIYVVWLCLYCAYKSYGLHECLGYEMVLVNLFLLHRGMFMDYKKLIKNRKTRNVILRLLSFIPDKMMLKLQYRIKMGRKLNLKNPTRFTEKLQWYKLYYRDPKMIPCVDKYDVRQIIADAGFGNILTKCYGVYDRMEDIDFDALPESFVMKDTLGGGGNSVILVKEKHKADLESIKKQLAAWVKLPYKTREGGREWPYYSGKKHRIIVEEFLHADPEAGGLIDYKFFCFQGRAESVYGVADRKPGVEAGIGIFDRDFCKIPYERVGEPLQRTLAKPDNYEQMLAIAETLGKLFPHVRVDLFNVEGRILFGELTFFNASGYMHYDPDSYDGILGDYFELPEKYPNT